MLSLRVKYLDLDAARVGLALVQSSLFVEQSQILDAFSDSGCCGLRQLC